MHKIESYKTYKDGIFAMLIAPNGFAYEMAFIDLAEAQSFVAAINAYPNAKA